MREILLIVLSCFFVACRTISTVPYAANPNIAEPEKIIEWCIKSQPPAWAYPPPFEVTVNKDCIEIRTTDPGGGWFFGGAPGELRTAIYFKNVGKLTLYNDRIWYVEILDRAGYWMYYVYSLDESSAKHFMDAMHTMMARQ